jgi:glucose-6-phosphate 1-dehydrogenase
MTSNSYKLKINTPTIFVIFGVSGDLSKRKLLTALLDLFNRQALPDKFRIVGVSRRDWTQEVFKKWVTEALVINSKVKNKSLIKKFVDQITFQQGDFTNLNDYKKLAEVLDRVDNSFGQCSNKMYHLAVPPDLYPVILKNINKSGLGEVCSGEGEGWTRILIEKPFGRDIKTATKLDMLLSRLFDERQIFRIDHYLAKETLQNILAFRFSNAIFEPVWNKDHIDKIVIKLKETDTVDSRVNFYEGVGALRDVGQSHLLQMLALVAMENPGQFDAVSIRKARAKVLKELSVVRRGDLGESVVRAQYQGYKSEKGIPKNSTTETYFYIKSFLKNSRWKGVPFYLESGKALDKALVEIKVYFKEDAGCFECATDQKPRNVLTFLIQPDEGIELCFMVKKPGLDLEVIEKKLAFKYAEVEEESLLADAYERLLFDCMRGDQTLFASTEEIKYSWKFVTPILKNWQILPLINYKKGSEGPRQKLIL